MARKYRKVYQHTWVDEKFSRLDPAEKLIVLHAITGPASNRIGIFPFSLALAAEQTGLDNVTPNVPGTFEGGSPAAAKTFRERFDNVCRCLGWKWDATAKVLFIPSWWKHNRPENPNVLRSALGDADALRPAVEAIITRHRITVVAYPDTLPDGNSWPQGVDARLSLALIADRAPNGDAIAVNVHVQVARPVMFCGPGRAIYNFGGCLPV